MSDAAGRVGSKSRFAQSKQEVMKPFLLVTPMLLGNKYCILTAVILLSEDRSTSCKQQFIGHCSFDTAKVLYLVHVAFFQVLHKACRMRSDTTQHRPSEVIANTRNAGFLLDGVAHFGLCHTKLELPFLLAILLGLFDLLQHSFVLLHIYAVFWIVWRWL